VNSEKENAALVRTVRL